MDDNVEMQPKATRLINLPDVQSSPNMCRRRSSDKASSPPPSVLVHSWLLSFSHYIALYAMLVARLGTRSDCRKLRAKSEVVRRRSVNFARKCQNSLLPLISDCKGRHSYTGEQQLTPMGSVPPGNCEIGHVYRRGSKKSNIEDYYRLFFLHCTCIEYFIEQLLRTAQLFRCFSLNIGRSLTSSLVAPPKNFIYSGLAEVERPRKKHSQLLPHRNRGATSACANDSLSGIDLDMQSKVSLVQTASMTESTDNHTENVSKVSDWPSAALKTDAKSVSHIKRFAVSQWCFHLQTKKCKIAEPSRLHNNVASSPKQSPYKASPCKVVVNPPLMLPHAENRKKVMESDTECFEMLVEDIQVIQSMVAEIHTSVPFNPWAIRPGRRKCRVQNTTNANGNTKCSSSTPDVHSGNESKQPFDVFAAADDDDDDDEEEDEEADDADWIDEDEDESWLQEEDDTVVRRIETEGADDHLSKSRRIEPCISSLSNWRWRFKQAKLSPSQKMEMKRKVELSAGGGVVGEFEEKSQEDDETILSKRLRRKKYICLSLIIVFAIGLFGSALGSCIYLLT